MKTVVKNYSTEQILACEVDFNKHFIGIEINRENSTKDYGYLLTDENARVLSIVALRGDTPWNNFLCYRNLIFDTALNSLLDKNEVKIFCFDNRKEFYRWVADHSE